MAQLSLTFRMPKQSSGGSFQYGGENIDMHPPPNLSLTQLFLASSSSLHWVEQLPKTKQFYSSKQQINTAF